MRTPPRAPGSSKVAEISLSNKVLPAPTRIFNAKSSPPNGPAAPEANDTRAASAACRTRGSRSLGFVGRNTSGPWDRSTHTRLTALPARSTLQSVARDARAIIEPEPDEVWLRAKEPHLPVSMMFGGNIQQGRAQRRQIARKRVGMSGRLVRKLVEKWG